MTAVGAILWTWREYVTCRTIYSSCIVWDGDLSWVITTERVYVCYLCHAGDTLCKSSQLEINLCGCIDIRWCLATFTINQIGAKDFWRTKHKDLTLKSGAFSFKKKIWIGYNSKPFFPPPMATTELPMNPFWRGELPLDVDFQVINPLSRIYPQERLVC